MKKPKAAHPHKNLGKFLHAPKAAKPVKATAPKPDMASSAYGRKGY